jgi:hypothetical protein
MNLLAQTRSKLTGNNPPLQLRVEDGTQRLECDFLTWDSLACAFASFVVSTGALANASTDQLRRLAESLSARLTYLLEPISAIEFDHEQCVVQLRSNPPQRDEDRTSYYELVVRRGGSLSLCRYAKEPGGIRHTIPVTVTHEVFFRLVGDFSAAAG